MCKGWNDGRKRNVMLHHIGVFCHSQMEEPQLWAAATIIDDRNSVESLYTSSRYLRKVHRQAHFRSSLEARERT